MTDYQPLDLRARCNAAAAVYGEQDPPPTGSVTLHGLPFLVGGAEPDPARCLIGLPHPSGANGHRHAQFAAVRADLTARVAAWFGRSTT